MQPANITGEFIRPHERRRRFYTSIDAFPHNRRELSAADAIYCATLTGGIERISELGCLPATPTEQMEMKMERHVRLRKIHDIVKGILGAIKLTKAETRVANYTVGLHTDAEGTLPQHVVADRIGCSRAFVSKTMKSIDTKLGRLYPGIRLVQISEFIASFEYFV